MKLGLRGKLFALSALVTVLGGAGPMLWLDRELRAHLLRQVEVELEHIARVAAVEAAHLRDPADRAAADALADRVGAATQARVTLLADDGQVVGDSEFDDLALAELGDHRERPEIVAARAAGRGVARRPSRSLGTDMLYVAVPASRPAGLSARASRRVAAVETTVSRARALLVAAGVLLVVVAALLGGVLSARLAATVGGLLDAARAVAAGDRKRRFEPGGSSELDVVASSFNEVLDDLAGTLRALGQQRDRLDAVLQALAEPVLGLDAEERVSLCNAAAVEALGRDPLGATLREVLPQLFERHDPSAEAGDETLALGDRRFLVRRTTQTDQAGSVLVLHDVTGVRRLEKMRRDFVANVSHELRTPVAVLEANAETLLDGALDDPAAAARFVGAIHRQAQHLGHLVADLLDIARIEGGQVRLAPEPVDALVACRRAADGLERPAADGGARIEVEVPLGLEVLADPKALEQVLTNLLDNALKYGGARVTARVRAAARRDEVRFEVHDDGPGIDPKHHDRLFERFYRVDKGRSRGMGGTGLGLSIVKHLVEGMGGTAGYSAASPRGSIFWFALPRPTPPSTELR